LQANSHIKLAGLFFVQTMSRGILLSVLPLQAFAILGNAQLTSTLYFAISAGGILGSLIMPVVIQTIGNYRSFLLGCAAMLLSSVLLSFNQIIYFSIGLFSHTFAIAAVEVSLTLYVLARVSRREMTRFEPMRMVSLVLALCIGPFLGVFLQEKLSHNTPYIICAVFAVLAILYFRWLGLHRVEISHSDAKNINPLHSIRRYIAQPRLRLAYGLILARSSWWTMFVIYMPIYCEQTGLGELVGAAIVSIGTAWTLSVPFWGWVARRYGVRFLLQSGFATTSLLLLLAYSMVDLPWVAASLMVVCALGATMLDGVGNVLFYRAVRGRERAEMTAVFSTYRDAGQLITPGLFAILLKIFALPVVFSTAAVWMMVAAYYSRYIPKQMK
jgi:MFS family permease